MIRSQERVQASAKSVTYPFQLLLAEKDVIVNNKASRSWYDRAGSKIKKIRLMAGAYHSTFKEPNRDVLFETALTFMGERLDGSVQGKPAKVFGAFKPALVKYYKPRPLMKRKKFWFYLALLAYLVIGLIMVRKRGIKRLLLAWPTSLRK